jgi:hypothetical protein
MIIRNGKYFHSLSPRTHQKTLPEYPAVRFCCFKTKELILLYLNERGIFQSIHTMQKMAGDAAKTTLHYFFVNLRTK